MSVILPRVKAGEPSGVAILRTIKGYEDFNEMTEVFEMLKGGFGLIDAPNLFTSRVDEILVAKNIKPTCSEPKVYLSMGVSETNDARAKGQYGTGGGYAAAGLPLNLMVSAHMDDFKATGSQYYLNWTREVLTDAFGGDVKMEQEESFIHTGIKHTRVQPKRSSNFRYILGQVEYASAIQPVTLTEHMKFKEDELLSGLLLNSFF